ncbi:MAG: hypothetical protein ACTSW3_00645, partial [Promethearchaeota archaeon]
MNKIALKIIENILDNYKDDYFYLKSDYDQHRNWEKEQIGKLLMVLFNQGNQKQKKYIYNLIIRYFNLIEDSGKFWNYTPKIVFDILTEYLIDNFSTFEQKFKQLVKDLVKQYTQVYRKYSLQFRGWDLFGGGNIFWGNEYKIVDWYFVSNVLEPALLKYYKNNPEKNWDFILNNCIIPESRISKENPDFLNRSAILILLERYNSENKEISNKSFDILKDFISFKKKGIPNKIELIFQLVRDGNIANDKKFYLLKIYFDNYQLPYSPFIEDIILQLAKEGYKELEIFINKWLKDPNYLQKSEMLGRDITSRIENYLDYSFPVGLKLFKIVISQDDFINNNKNYEVYQIAKILNRIIYQDFQTGIEIINNIIKNKKLSDNQQILIFYCLLPKSEDINKPENLEIFEKLYYDFLSPFLDNLNNNIKKIEERITQSQAREAIVDFAEVLAKHNKVKEAIRIIEIFIDDSDPCTPQKIDPKDPEGNYDKHQQIINGEGTNTITTVRGKCAWALRSCIGLAGRKYLEKIIYLTEKLTNDKNYYIQEQSCITLSRLAQVRFSVMPKNKEELFFSEDKEKALKMAKKVEQIAFDLLEKFLSLDQKPRNVLINQLLRVFNYLKSINQESAEKLLSSIIKCNEEVIREAVPLFIYFAEFRHRFYHDWKWSLPGLFDDLADFNNENFKSILIDMIKKGNPKINAKFAWHFNDIVKNAMGDNKELKSIIKYDEAFKLANNYLNIIAENYNKDTFERIYSFIKRNMDKNFEECYELWKKCVYKECDFIKSTYNSENIREMYWWP